MSMYLNNQKLEDIKIENENNEENKREYNKLVGIKGDEDDLTIIVNNESKDIKKELKYIESSGVVVTLDGNYVFKKGEDGLIKNSFAGKVKGLRTGTIEDNLQYFVYKNIGEELGIKGHEIEKIQLLRLYKNERKLNVVGVLFYVIVNLTDGDIEDLFNEINKGIDSIVFEDNIKDVSEILKEGNKATINVEEFLEHNDRQ